MDLDSGIPLIQLLVDGGMAYNAFLMQLQSNILNIDVGKVWLVDYFERLQGKCRIWNLLKIENEDNASISLCYFKRVERSSFRPSKNCMIKVKYQ